MFQYRPVLIIVGIALILGLVLWFVGTLGQLYTSVALTSPLLANLLLGLVLLLLAVLLGVFIYYCVQFFRPATKRSPTLPRVPLRRTDAAGETLQAVRQQVAQIQDEVARQAFEQRSRDIEAELARGHLQVVIFGTGSAGKTSIVNAVIGRMVGQVGAPMGTTDVGEIYPFRFKTVEREIQLIDTPGILEAGLLGGDRQQRARQLATEADLLLFVVDNDLRQSEFEALRTLAHMGKRMILVFNKTDLYSDDDLENILRRIQQRVQNLVAANDVVAIAARPQPVTLDRGERIQPQPYILPLLRRMAAILRDEGEDLIADNILLQSQRLGDEARQIIDQQRQRQAEAIVERFQWISGGVISVMPLPVIDLLATAAINAQMVIEIGRVYGCEINADRAKELAVSLAKTLAGLGVVKGAIELSTFALKMNVGTLIMGQAVQGVTAAYLTRIAGKSFIEYFRRNQDWGDGGMTEVVQEQFQLNRRDEFVRGFVQQAIAQIVTPLQRNPLSSPPSPHEIPNQAPDRQG
ncbi:MAG: GTP-binding protein [Synechococcales bacterium]|nr:GTP-binding protein [Synechococcales bacterium]